MSFDSNEDKAGGLDDEGSGSTECDDCLNEDCPTNTLDMMEDNYACDNDGGCAITKPFEIDTDSFYEQLGLTSAQVSAAFVRGAEVWNSIDTEVTIPSPLDEAKNEGANPDDHSYVYAEERPADPASLPGMPYARTVCWPALHQYYPERPKEIDKPCYHFECDIVVYAVQDDGESSDPIEWTTAETTTGEDVSLPYMFGHELGHAVGIWDQIPEYSQFTSDTITYYKYPTYPFSPYQRELTRMNKKS